MQTENQTSKIKPADRLASVSEYYFSKKLKEVAQMNAEGKDVISLGIGSPDMPPSEATIQTLCREAQNPDGHGYMPYVGIPELRRSFAAWYKKWYGVELNPNTEIQPLIGSKEGILHVTLAFVNPGEQVLVPNPGYPTYTSLSKILGAEVINYNLKEENGWMPDFDELEKMDMSRVKLMWTNYPNMPTGANATPELYAKLVDFAHPQDYVFPVLRRSVHITAQQQYGRVQRTNKRINRYLKLIGEHLHLPITLTTYVARHSFATVLKRSGVSTSIISESLGHSSEKITQIYLDSFENSQIDAAMQNLL